MNRTRIPEKFIERQVLQYCHAAGIFAFKVRSTGSIKEGKFIKPPRYHRIGVSDIVGAYAGVPFVCELKAEGGRLTEDQKLFLEDAARAGYKAFVCHSLDEFITTVKQIAINSDRA